MKTSVTSQLDMLKAIIQHLGKEFELSLTQEVEVYNLSLGSMPESRPIRIDVRKIPIKIMLEDLSMVRYAASLASYYAALGKSPKIYYDGKLVKLGQTETAGIEAVLYLSEQEKRGESIRGESIRTGCIDI